MKNSALILKPFIKAAILIGMAALWILFAPVQFGGQASYVMIAGASMEPELRWGDLVINRQAADYHVGDVVTYQHPIVGPVIHRIIEKSSNTYTLKGDNNTWIDSYKPSSDEIIGKAWIPIPSAASVLYELRKPAWLSLLSLAIGFTFLVTLTQNNDVKKPQDSTIRGKKRDTLSPSLSALVDGWAFPLATILLASILLGVAAFSRPMMQKVLEDIPYAHHGNFTYQGTGAPGVYDKGRIETGDPVFHSLASTFNVTFEYTLTSPASATSHGRYRMILQVSEPNGWRRETELVPSTQFSDSGFIATATIDLIYVQSLVQELEAMTGFKRLPYDVQIIPIIVSEATIAGHTIVEQFSPALHFKLDDYQLYLDGTNPFDEESDLLNPVQDGTQSEYRLVPATLTILGLDLQVETARWITTIAGLTALIGLVVTFYPIILSWKIGESNQIQLRYGDQMLEVKTLPKVKAGHITEVSSFSDLLKIANTKDDLILHHASKGLHTYMLQTDEGAFRYNLQEEVEEVGG